MKSFVPFLAAGAVLAGSSPARACDLCAVYSAFEAEGAASSGWTTSVAEQFTRFRTLRVDGTEIPNDTGQRLDSSITQLVAAYRFNDRLGLQLDAPCIHRSFQRPDGFETDRGTESGLGDVSLLGKILLLQRDTASTNLRWGALAGLKFPTGSTRRIAEELNETGIEGAPESGVHGHDLTLGTGSTDVILGTNLFVRAARFFATATAHYTMRRPGDYGYRFADEFSWELAPGGYLLLEHTGTIALQAVVSGDHKGKDRFRGAEADDTGLTAIYLGPRLTFTRGAHWSGELGLDLPVRTRNTALQLVADQKIRAGMTVTF